MAQPSVHGRFIWQELVTDDMAAAGRFYSKVIGWHMQAATHQGGNYSILANEHGGVGGVTSLADEGRPSGGRTHWLPYVGAENVDATAAKAERLGGRILHAAADVEDVGRYAVLADPQGAAFGIYRPKSPASAGRNPPRPGEFAWQELASSDFEAALRFYGDLFGWQVLQRMEMGASGTYVLFGRDGVQQGGMYKLSAQAPAPFWLSYIEVANTEAAAEAARQAGGRVTSGPMDVPGGRMAQLLDPHGVPFAVHTTNRTAASAGTGAATTAGAATPGSTPGHAPQPAARPARPARPATPASSAPTPAPGAGASGSAGAAGSAMKSSATPAAAGGSGATMKAPAPAAAKPAAKPSAPAPAAATVARSPSAPAATSAAKAPAQKKVAKKAAPPRAAKKAAKKVAKKAAKKAARRPAKKAARKTARKAARRSAHSARAKRSAKSKRMARAGRSAGRRAAGKRAGRAGSARGRGGRRRRAARRG